MINWYFNILALLHSPKQSCMLYFTLVWWPGNYPFDHFLSSSWELDLGDIFIVSACNTWNIDGVWVTIGGIFTSNFCHFWQISHVLQYQLMFLSISGHQKCSPTKFLVAKNPLCSKLSWDAFIEYILWLLSVTNSSAPSTPFLYRWSSLVTKKWVADFTKFLCSLSSKSRICARGLDNHFFIMDNLSSCAFPALVLWFSGYSRDSSTSISYLSGNNIWFTNCNNCS